MRALREKPTTIKSSQQKRDARYEIQSFWALQSVSVDSQLPCPPQLTSLLFNIFFSSTVTRIFPTSARQLFDTFSYLFTMRERMHAFRLPTRPNGTRRSLTFAAGSKLKTTRLVGMTWRRGRVSDWTGCARDSGSFACSTPRAGRRWGSYWSGSRSRLCDGCGLLG